MLLSKVHFIAILLFSFLAFSCSTGGEEKKGIKKLKITTTTGMLSDAIKNIVFDSAEVIALMGPGVDPHLYKASHGDLEKLGGARVIVHNGLHLEGKMGVIFEKLSQQKTVITAAAGLRQDQLRRSSQFKGSVDPHIWFNVALWRQAVAYTGAELIKADTLHAAFYKMNLQKYLTQLDSLDAWVKQQLHTVPQEKRVLITAHDAFGYFGDAYAIEVKGLQGISTLSDFGLNDISSLVNLISQRKIKAVFVESSVPRKSIDAVVEGCLARGHKVTIGGTLYSDAMGSPGTPEDNYIGMVRYNVNTIVHALK